MPGTLENVSLLWRQTAQRCGLDERSWVHGVEDGAPWIVEKFKENFGAQGKYLIDFYHVSEYLAAAALPIAGPVKASRWLKKQKSRLMTGQARKVLRSLGHSSGSCGLGPNSGGRCFSLHRPKTGASSLRASLQGKAADRFR